MSKDIEDLSLIGKNYTEKPIFVNNLTTIPYVELFDLNFTIKNEIIKKEILISCNFKKLTPEFLKLINQISKFWLEVNGKKLHLNYFAGTGGRITDCLYGCQKSVNNKYSDSKIHLSDKTYDDYMSSKAKCYIAFDSYPYAGFTTILENIKLKIPTIVLKGNEVVNRFPIFIYEKLNLTELIVTNFEEYYNLAIKLLTNDCFYKEMKNKLEKNNINNFFNQIDCEESFISAFESKINDYELQTLSK